MTIYINVISNTFSHYYYYIIALCILIVKVVEKIMSSSKGIKYSISKALKTVDFREMLMTSNIFVSRTRPKFEI